MLEDARLRCGICKELKPPLETTIGWCVRCQHFVCYQCWLREDKNLKCPGCETILRKMEEGVLIKLLQDNPGARRCLHIERSCIPFTH